MKKINRLSIRSFFHDSYRRRMLDGLLNSRKFLFAGSVLDIGGRDRGHFVKPREQSDRWIFADISTEHHPDIVLDVCDMHPIKDRSIDVVLATELFEHVYDPQLGLKECFRVLKQGGIIILSAPFLYPIHADPFDYQRWTMEKWKKELASIGFALDELVIMGYFFTTTAEFLRRFISGFPKPIRLFGYLFFPLFELVVRLDRAAFVLNNPRLNSFHGGYFIVARKGE